MGHIDEAEVLRDVKCCCCCLACFAIIVTLTVELVVAFAIIRPIAITVDDASLTRLALLSTTTPATALACNLSLTLAVRNPNWAMTIKNTKPLEAVYSFGGHRFNRVQLAAVGNKQGVKKTVVYRLTPGADSAYVALDDASVAEFIRQNAAGAFEIEVLVSGEIKYTARATKCKIEATCPLKVQLVSPGEAPSALLLDQVKCKLLEAAKNC